MKTGVIVGRFQTPYLHAGHLLLIATALRECDDVLILVGSQTTKDERNPYSYMERMTMIRRIFPQVHTEILHDVEGDNDTWSKDVDYFISKYTGRNTKSVILYHSRDSFKPSYTGKHQLQEVEEIPGMSATKIREQLKMTT